MYPVIHISVPSYTVMAAIGALSAVILIYFRLEKYELSFLNFLKMFAVCAVFGFLGSRVVYVFSRMPWLISNFNIKNFISTIVGGGLVFYGGLLGVLLAVFICCKKKDIDSKKVYEMIAPAIPLFHAFGRIGCFMSGCCYGVELKTPISFFGIVFFNRIPTQLIETLFELLMFVIIMIIQKASKHIDSLKFYMITYAVFRFFIEFFRGDMVRGFYFGFSTSQIISMGIIIFYLVKKVSSKRQDNKALNIPS